MPTYDIVSNLDEAEEYAHLIDKERRGLCRLFAQTHGPTVPYPLHPQQRAVALDLADGDIVGLLLTSEGSEEMYLWVHEAYRRQGVGTALVKHYGSGGAVACTEEGSAFLFALHDKLTSDEREFFDIPCWAVYTDRE